MNENSFLTSPLYLEAAEAAKTIISDASKRHLDLFGQVWYNKHFRMADFARTESEFNAILGDLHAAPAASTINQYSERPIRSLDGFGKVKAEMLTHAHTYKLEAEDLRAIAIQVRMLSGYSDRAKLFDFIVKRLMNVREKAIQGVQNRLDYIILEMLSNDGKYTFTAQNDPLSPYVGQTIDFGFDPSHAGKVTTTWTEANKDTVNILEDVMGVYQAAEVKPTKMLMRIEQLMYMLTTAKMKLYVNGSDRASAPISVEDVNTLFAKYGLPSIELVQRDIRINKNGGKTFDMVQPWKEGKILFVPSNDFGTIEHQYTDADLGLKSPGVEYSKYNNIEVTNWVQGLKEGTNYTEFTSAGITATPVVDSIKSMYSLDVLKTAN